MIANSVFSIVPEQVDDQREITCKAENPQIRGRAVEDTMLLSVMCKWSTLSSLLVIAQLLSDCRGVSVEIRVVGLNPVPSSPIHQKKTVRGNNSHAVHHIEVVERRRDFLTYRMPRIGT